MLRGGTKFRASVRQIWSLNEQGNLLSLVFSLLFFWLCLLQSADCLCVMKLSDSLPWASALLAVTFSQHGTHVLTTLTNCSPLFGCVWFSFHMGSVSVGNVFAARGWTDIISPAFLSLPWLFSKASYSISIPFGYWLKFVFSNKYRKLSGTENWPWMFAQIHTLLYVSFGYYLKIFIQGLNKNPQPSTFENYKEIWRKAC